MWMKLKKPLSEKKKRHLLKFILLSATAHTKHGVWIVYTQLCIIHIYIYIYMYVYIYIIHVYNIMYVYIHLQYMWKTIYTYIYLEEATEMHRRSYRNGCEIFA